VKVKFGKISYGAVRGKSRPMYLLLAGNDTVQILMQRGIDVRCINECRLVLLVIWYGFDANS